GSTGSAAPILTLAVAEQAPEFRPHRRRDVAALERIGDVGGKKAHLRATIEAPAVEFEAIERLGLGELDHRIGELDLTARAAPLGGKNVEDLRLEDVAAGDDEVRGRAFPRRLLDHLGDREQAAPAFADADHSIHVDTFGRHLLDRDDIRALAEVARRVDHLRQAAAVVLYQHVRQQQRERLVAYELARAPHRMP